MEEDNLHRKVTDCIRELSLEENEKLERQNTRLVSNFQAEKSFQNAMKNWDIFYKRNETRFFKDRHWTTREFNELLGDVNDREKKLKMLEVGCGVGNLIFPLLEENTNLFINACDFSQRAVQFVKQHELFDSTKLNVFCADVTQDNLNQHLEHESIDIVTLIFVLSAIHPDKFIPSLQNIKSIMKKDGVILFRDYGVYDMAQLRFKPGHKITENHYLRQDGTCSYFFSLEELRTIFKAVGFTEVSCNFIWTKTLNIKENINVPRVFVQAKFQNN